MCTSPGPTQVADKTKKPALRDSLRLAQKQLQSVTDLSAVGFSKCVFLVWQFKLVCYNCVPGLHSVDTDNIMVKLLGS